MHLSLGTSNLANFSRMQHPKEIGKFLHEILTLGHLFIDTAPLYSALDSEKILGRFLPESEFKNVSISSKYGYWYSRLPFPLNRVSQRAFSQGSDTNRRRIENSSPRFELSKSLLRLKRTSLDTFFFHGEPEDDRFQIEVAEMLKLKEEGLISKIGLSTNQKLRKIDKNIDVIQIPYSNLNYYESFAGPLFEVHSIVRSSEGMRTNIEDTIIQLSQTKRVSKAIIGTTNITHYRDIRGLIDNYA